MNAMPTATPDLDRAAILAQLSELICEVVGPEYLGDIEITEQTIFESELGFESIDVVVLAEMLRAQYGDRLRLDQWWKMLVEKGIKEVGEVSVGNLAEFIVVCLSEPKTA